MSSSSSAPYSNPTPTKEPGKCCLPCDNCPPGVQSHSPVRYWNGAAVVRVDDLVTPGGGLFGHTRYYANQMYDQGVRADYPGPNGYNWYVSQLAYAATPDGGGTVAIFFDPNNPYWFTATGGGNYTPSFLSQNTLDVSLTDDGVHLIFTQTDGGKTRITKFNNFNSANPTFFSYTDERGALTTVASTNSDGQITELQRSVGGAVAESLQYAYFSGGLDAGLLSSVTYRKMVGGSWTFIQRVNYDYCGTSDPNGSVNDLRSATRQVWNGTGWVTVAVEYYRYHVAGSGTGFVHGLKSRFGPEAYRLMFNAGINLSTASDSTVNPYADHVFQYDSSRRVTVETSAVCPSCPGGGTTSDRFVYSSSGKADGVNTWSTKTQQTLPDSSQIVVYASYTGMPILTLQIDPTGTQTWATYYRYDLNGRQILKAHPSAVSGYNETYDDLVNYTGGAGSLLRAASGLIESTVYYTTTGSGGAAGYVQYEQVQQGQGGAAVTVRQYTYQGYVSNTVYPVASVTEYPVAGSTTPSNVTSYSYSYTGAVLTGKVTTFPAVLTTHNGSGAADSITEAFDSNGFPSQITDERGVVNTFLYDPVMGVMTRQTLNYLVGGSGPGVNLTTNFTFDDFGRLTLSAGPSHTVVLSGSATSVQGVSSYAYSQSALPTSGAWAPDQSTSAKGYYDGASYTLIDPVTITNSDKDGRAIDQITSHRTAGSSGLLSAGESFYQTDWQTWASTQYNSRHQTVSQRTYFLIPSSGAGTAGTNYAETDWGYDALERRNREASPGGTITRRIWATPQRVASEWVGTNDSGASDSDPTGFNSIQFVQAGAQTGGSGSASVSMVNPVTAGNTLVAYGASSSTSAPGSTSVSDSLGNTWTLVKSQAGAGGGAGGAGMWIANVTTGGGLTVTFSPGGTQCALAVAEYSGVRSASPVDTSASATSSTSGTTPDSGSLTTANAADVILAGASQNAAAVTWKAGTGFTVRASASSSGTVNAALEDRLVSSAAAYDPFFTMSPAEPWTAIAIALKSVAASSGNNMVKVLDNQYDGGSAGGDGNLTQQTQYASATDTRITAFGFDFRDRQTSRTDALNGYIVWTHDNLGRQTQEQQYVSPTGNLINQNASNFDARGRVYQQVAYAVDPSTGTVGNALTTNNWYDPSGNVVQQIQAGDGQAFSKSAYNAVGWVTATYRGYNTGGTSYSQAQIVTGDIIVEQSQSTFDEVGNTVSVASFQRLNDASATTTGALTSSNSRISYTANWFDGIDRLIASADYGAISSFTRPSTPPSSSATMLVSQTGYNASGLAYQTTDPKGIATQSSFDNANRVTQKVEDYGASGHLNRTTNFTYTLDGLLATMTAVNSATGDQTTTWTYGTTLAESGVARADLLRYIDYPDSTSGSDRVSYTYNRLGEMATITDQRGTVRTLHYDKLGRPTNDCVTTVGSDTDSTVLQIATAYEARGMVQSVTSLDSATAGSGTPLNQVYLTYNSFRQLAKEQQDHSGNVGGSTPSVQYAYDSGASGSNEVRLKTLIYPNGRNIAYSFGASGGMSDRLGRVDSIQDTTTGTTTLAAYAYLGLGSVVRIDYPQPQVRLDLWGGVSGSFAGLDRFGRITDQRWLRYGSSTSSSSSGSSGGSSPVDIDRYQYGYDLNSNRSWKRNVVGTAAVSGGLDEYYTYDNLNRLTDMKRGTLNSTGWSPTGVNSPATLEQGWSLDPTGNWTQYATLAGGNPTMSQGRGSNATNEITAITSVAPPPPPTGTPTPTAWATPAYDAAGNMKVMPQPASPTSSFSAVYDAWNRLVEARSGGSVVAQYRYDGRKRRIVSLATQNRHFYFTNNWQDIEERIGTSTTMDQQQVWGLSYADALVCRDDATALRLFGLYQGDFSLSTVVDTNGNPREHYTSEPYGPRAFYNGSWTAISASGYAWSAGYQGLYHDPTIQLLSNRNRIRHPSLGVFLQRDPAGYADGSSLYACCRGNPICAVDPDGNDSVALNIPGVDMGLKGNNVATSKLLVNIKYTIDCAAASMKINDAIVPGSLVRLPARATVTGPLNKNGAETYQSTDVYTNIMLNIQVSAYVVYAKGACPSDCGIPRFFVSGTQVLSATDTLITRFYKLVANPNKNEQQPVLELDKTETGPVTPFDVYGKPQSSGILPSDCGCEKRPAGLGMGVALAVDNFSKQVPRPTTPSSAPASPTTRPTSPGTRPAGG